jgi:hypothetical protein
MTGIPFTIRPRCNQLPLAVELCRLHQMTAALDRCAAEAGADLSRDPVARIERHKRLARAICDNSQLMAGVLDCLLEDRDGLPPRLGWSLVRLAALGLRLGPQVLGRRAELHALIEVNRSVISGLNRLRGIYLARSSDCRRTVEIVRQP